MTRLSVSESDLKSSIQDYLQILENRGLVYSDRLNSGKLLVAGRDDTRYMVNLCKTGTGDLFFIFQSHIYFVETKKKGEKQKPEQKEFQEKVENVGAFYWLVDSFEQFENLLHGIGL